MLKLLWEWWQAAYGNYIAQVTTLPFAFWWHHSRMKKLIDKKAEDDNLLL